jgi:hypothetical protein
VNATTTTAQRSSPRDARAPQASSAEQRERSERLGNTRPGDPQQVSELAARQDRRTDRYRLREWLREHAVYQRSRHCGLTLRTSEDPTLRLSGTPGVDAVMGVAGVVTCGQRLCPPCAARIGRREAQQIADTLAVHRDTVYTPELVGYGLGGGHAVLATFTLRHHLGQALVLLLAVVQYAWRQVSSGRGYAKLAEDFGVVGWIRSLEITWGRAHGWHPHLHVLILLDHPMSQLRADELAWRLFEPWQRGVRRKGADALAERGIDVKVCDLGDMSSGVLGAYLSKIGHEVAGSHNKIGRDVESFTLVDLLREVRDTYEETAFLAFRELEATIAGKRRKFLTWSAGAQEMRARAGHGHRDKTDEELAEEDEIGSPDLIAVNREDWGLLAVRLEQLYRVGENEGLGAVKVWLSRHGIRWRELDEHGGARPHARWRLRPGVRVPVYLPDGQSGSRRRTLVS